MPENVNHPSHYNAGQIEVIDAIEDWKLGFHLGNVVKYVARAEHKGGLEDLKKARWYLERFIQHKEQGDGLRGESDRGQLGALRPSANDHHGNLSAFHSCGSDDAPGSGKECGEQPGNTAPQDADDDF